MTCALEQKSISQIKHCLNATSSAKYCGPYSFPLIFVDMWWLILVIFALQLSSATTDEQVRTTLTSDVVLDVLESIGYTGIPQKETLTGVQPIIQ